jgi:cilla- and flagella-associated protein
MMKLTEEMVVARTRISDLTNVKKLNCWGADLSDVSLLRKMPNVEVLALR